MTTSSEAKLHLNVDDVVWREVGEELVILELSTSTYLTLNGTAKYIWEALASGATVDSLVESLATQYRIPTEQARDDTEAFLSALLDRNLLARDV